MDDTILLTIDQVERLVVAVRRKGDEKGWIGRTCQQGVGGVTDWLKLLYLGVSSLRFFEHENGATRLAIGTKCRQRMA